MKIIGMGLIALLLFILEGKIYKKYWDKHLKANVFFVQKGITEGEKGEITEIIENRKKLPLTMLKVKFQTSRNLIFEDNPGSNTTDRYYRNDVFQIGGGEKITRTLTFEASKRGYYHIHSIDLVSTDLFMQANFVKSMSTACYLYVYPKIYDTGEFVQSLQKLNGEILVKRHLLEDPFEYRGIREYQPFDDIRSVNWKATAKTGNVMVNQKNYTALQTIRIFLNVEDSGIYKKEQEVESSLQLVMGLAVFFLQQGVKVSCYTNGKDIITGEAVCIEGGAGQGQRDVIGKALARLDTSVKPFAFCDLFKESILDDGHSTITIFVAPNAYEEFLEVLDQCEENKISYTWFYPYDSNELPDLPSKYISNVRFMKSKKK